MLVRWGLPIVAVLSLALAALSVAQQTPRDVLLDPPTSPPRADFPRAIAATGVVEGEGENVSISTPVQGLVVAVHCRAGERVAAGAPLFSLDGRDLVAERDARRATAEVARARLARLAASPRPEELPILEGRVREAEALLADARARLARRERIVAGGAATAEEEASQRHAAEAAAARLEQARAELTLLRAGAWGPDVAVARAEVEAAEAAVRRVEADLERLVVRAPRDGTVLSVKVRAGEFAPSGPIDPPLVVLGKVERLHVRVDVDEHEAWRFVEAAPARAHLRGDPARSAPLAFVRVEPLVVPKVTLSGRIAERVDTRVLQVIYALEPGALAARPGEQLDVFIEVR